MSSRDSFSINPLPAPLSHEDLALARRIEPATFGHMLGAGFTGSEMRCFSAGDVIVSGNVVTCRAEGDDNAIVHYAVSHLRPGDFLVISRYGDVRQACFGGGLALAAHKAGCVGILVYGPVTDLAELRALNMPVWGTGVTALTSKRHYREGSFCTPVTVGQMVVEPGMVAIGDENGVVFLTRETFHRLALKAIDIQERQALRRVQLEAGAKVGEVNGTLAEFARILNAPLGNEAAK